MTYKGDDLKRLIQEQDENFERTWFGISVIPDSERDRACHQCSATKAKPDKTYSIRLKSGSMTDVTHLCHKHLIELYGKIGDIIGL